ncbi:putative membrane protein [Erwinia amylovora ATCC 49946]|nr:putative membrane protein [Erwinia amylovora ATCC 49946]
MRVLSGGFSRFFYNKKRKILYFFYAHNLAVEPVFKLFEIFLLNNFQNFHFELATFFLSFFFDNGSACSAIDVFCIE